MSVITITALVITIFSIVVHEVSHGIMAHRLGDPTAYRSGRLTFNPLAHLDPFGSVLLPAFLMMTGAPFMFGWARPVPYNPYNLRAGRWGEPLVAFAGPLSNILIAVIFSAIAAIMSDDAFMGTLAYMVVVTNVMLALFNMIPIPPLDGSKILGEFLPSTVGDAYHELKERLEAQPLAGFVIVIIVMTLLGGAFTNLVLGVSQFLISLAQAFL